MSKSRLRKSRRGKSARKSNRRNTSKGTKSKRKRTGARVALLTDRDGHPFDFPSFSCKLSLLV